jgi:hypothetical protein
MNFQSRIRCAVCNAVRSFCHCPEDVPFSTSKDAGPCPDKVEDKAAAKETIREKFERFCDDNPDHHDCRIYD